MSILKFIFGDINEKEVKKLDKMADLIESLESKFEQMSDEALRQMTVQFKERLAKGETLDDILPEAFAVAREEIGRAHV